MDMFVIFCWFLVTAVTRSFSQQTCDETCNNQYHCDISRKGVQLTEKNTLDPTFEDCQHVQDEGHNVSGVYLIKTKDVREIKPFYVFCDMTTDGGGWLVFQRREDDSIDFYRPWNEYKLGFGKLTGEMWLGNDKLHSLTFQKRYELRVDLADKKNTGYAVYNAFSILDEYEKYKLLIGSFTASGGGVGDALYRHNGMYFSTKDRDYDKRESTSCSVFYQGAWWYHDCYSSNLNSMHSVYKAWNSGSLTRPKFTEMKLRPKT